MTLQNYQEFGNTAFFEFLNKNFSKMQIIDSLFRKSTFEIFPGKFYLWSEIKSVSYGFFATCQS